MKHSIAACCQWKFSCSYPISRMARRVASTSFSLVIEAGPRTSPASTTRLVVTSVSTPQRAWGSTARKVSTIASEMRSQILSGWPSDTDSLVNTKSRLAKCLPFLRGRQEHVSVDAILWDERQARSLVRHPEIVGKSLFAVAFGATGQRPG